MLNREIYWVFIACGFVCDVCGISSVSYLFGSVMMNNYFFSFRYDLNKYLYGKLYAIHDDHLNNRIFNDVSIFWFLLYRFLFFIHEKTRLGRFPSACKYSTLLWFMRGYRFPSEKYTGLHSFKLQLEISRMNNRLGDDDIPF